MARQSTLFESMNLIHFIKIFSLYIKIKTATVAAVAAAADPKNDSAPEYDSALENYFAPEYDCALENDSAPEYDSAPQI